LLTGRPPFDDDDLTTLVTKVKTEAPRSPRVLRPPVSRGLARVVLRMLAKSPADRPAHYAALISALRPYASSAARPAVLGLRFAAGVMDQLMLALVVAPFTTNAAFKVSFDNARSGPSADAPSLPPWALLLSATLSFSYYTLTEGLTGSSIGKRVFGLR